VGLEAEDYLDLEYEETSKEQYKLMTRKQMPHIQ